MSQHLFTQIIIILAVVALFAFIVLITYIVRFLKVFSQFKLRFQQLKNQQRENRYKIAMIKQKVVTVETTPLLGKKTRRVLQYKNATTSVIRFRKQQKLKQSEKQLKKIKARKVQRKVCKKYGK